MQSDEVFEQKIVCSPTTASSAAKAFAFSSTFSMIASMIEVAVLQVLELRRAGEVAERLVLRLGRDLALLDAVGEELLDPAEALRRGSRCFDFADDRLVARRRAHLRDARRPSGRSRARRLS